MKYTLINFYLITLFTISHGELEYTLLLIKDLSTVITLVR